MKVKPTILIVDDEPITLQILVDNLTSAGYFVESAANGEEAWKLLTQSRHNFAAIITDRIMPRMDGVELTKHIQNQAAFKHIPVIMLTSVAEREEAIAAVQGGVFDFLIKPVEKELLLMVIRRALLR